MKPQTIRIHSKNNDFQHIEVLKNNRKKRSKNNAFFVEGAKAINNAVANGWVIESLIYAFETELSAWAKDILLTSRALKHIEMPQVLMNDLSDKESDLSELLAVVKMADDALNRIKISHDSLIIVIDRSSNHGNLGTIIRTCEGLGVDGIVLSGHSVDLYDVRTIRASLGALFSVPVVRVGASSELDHWFSDIKDEYPDFQIVGSTAATEMMVDEANFKNPTALLIGNETHGLGKKFKEGCDVMVKIPMYGRSTSYNVACATAMMLYEADRQRRGNI